MPNINFSKATFDQLLTIVFFENCDTNIKKKASEELNRRALTL